MKNNENKWFSAKEISNKLKLSMSSVDKSLRRLRKGKSIYFKLAKRKLSRYVRLKDVYVYKYKR